MPSRCSRRPPDFMVIGVGDAAWISRFSKSLYAEAARPAKTDAIAYFHHLPQERRDDQCAFIAEIVCVR